tara:strand:+ start:1409 stop:2200 length:792 start_codon:yes stop_codon:yes gene_type:complete
MSNISSININNNYYKIDLNSPIDISIPISSKHNPSFYDDNPLKIKYFESNNKVWSTAHGASCNIPVLELNIHCGATHTECRSHITKEDITIVQCQKNIFTRAHLITLEPKKNTNNTYHHKIDKNDFLITKEMLFEKLSNIEKKYLNSLIIRTKPNISSSLNNNYNLIKNPFFSNEAIEYITILGINNLVVDIPSIDKYDDGGKLGNHRIFWELDSERPNKNTITEFAYINNEIEDGDYILLLSILNIELDTSPSRPIIYKILK